MNPEKRYIEVVLPLTVHKSYTYQLPPAYDGPVFIGQRVIAPLKNSKTLAFVWRTSPIPPADREIKPIEEIIDLVPLFPVELFSFLEKLAHYYLCPLGKVLAAAIPAEYRLLKNRQLSPTALPAAELSAYRDLYDYIAQKGARLLADLKRKFAPDYLSVGLTALKKNGYIQEAPVFRLRGTRHAPPQRIQLTAPVSELTISSRARRQQEIINALLSANGLITDAYRYSFSANALATPQAKGLINITYETRAIENLWQNYTERQKEITLSPDQEHVVQTIGQALTAEKFAPFLLEGVTGSGKTEIYLKLIHGALQRGRGALVLVPEITLTSHLAGRFRGEFAEKIAIWHSNLTTAQRSNIWQAIQKGEYPVVIGARSAIFLPIPNLGLIIVDEEQDTSFKQKGQEPRYQARDAALLRGQVCQATVVLGSATPSLETYYNSATGKLSRLVLPHRYSKAPNAIIHIVDMKQEFNATGNSQNPLSRLLVEKIQTTLDRNQQILLLQNRRGYSHVLLCADCGWVQECRNCDIPMTYHKKQSLMLCHYCYLTTRPPTVCPQCQSNRFLFPGVGTQKVETVLKDLFPSAIVSRLDLDAKQERDYTQRILRRFEQNKIQILLGTQMIAKGLDFPNVTLVGVINADIGLYLPDFRARERVFQLLYQVSGRAGRGEIQGEIVIQSFNPQDFAIRAAVQQNLEMFINRELNERNPLNYPPFSRLALIQVSDLNDQRADSVAHKVADFLLPLRGKIEISGPAPAPLSRLNNRYRYLLILKSRKEHDPNGYLLRALLQQLLNSKTYSSLSHQARLTIDIDPMDLL